MINIKNADHVQLVNGKFCWMRFKNMCYLVLRKNTALQRYQVYRGKDEIIGIIINNTVKIVEIFKGLISLQASTGVKKHVIFIYTIPSILYFLLCKMNIK